MLILDLWAHASESVHVQPVSKSVHIVLSLPIDPSMASMSGMLGCPMMEEESGQPVSGFTYHTTPWLRDIMSSCTWAVAWGCDMSVLSRGTSMLLRYE